MIHKFVIDDNIERIANKYKTDMLNKVTAKENLQNLIDNFKNHNYEPTNKNEVVLSEDYFIRYISEILKDYEILLTLHPSNFRLAKRKYDRILPEGNLKTDIKYSDKKGKKRSIKFHELLVKALNYSKVQADIFPTYIRDNLEIRTCVYCNAQYAATTKSGKAMYELDHYIPKSIAPYLCTSFFNLQPCCSSCNKRKLDNLFVEDIWWKYNVSIWKEKADSLDDLYKFKLKEGCYAEYKSSHNKDDLVVELIPIDNQDTNSLKLLIKVDAKLKLNELYKCFNDVVEDIIWKKQCYSKDLVDGLQRQFLKEMPDLYRGIDRFILGYSTDEDDIYKRPLTKMVQDVSRQLNLIR